MEIHIYYYVNEYNTFQDLNLMKRALSGLEKRNLFNSGET